MTKIITHALPAALAAAAVAVPLALAASPSAASPSARVVHTSRPVTVVLPARSEDDESRGVAIYGGAAHVYVGATDIRISPAGPASYGDYDGRRHAWVLTVIPPAR